MTQRKKLRGNQCISCEKTHEECADSSCPRSDISIHVCNVFGTLPYRVYRRNKKKH